MKRFAFTALAGAIGTAMLFASPNSAAAQSQAPGMSYAVSPRAASSSS